MPRVTAFTMHPVPLWKPEDETRLFVLVGFGYDDYMCLNKKSGSQCPLLS